MEKFKKNLNKFKVVFLQEWKEFSKWEKIFMYIAIAFLVIILLYVVGGILPYILAIFVFLSVFMPDDIYRFLKSRNNVADGAVQERILWESYNYMAKMIYPVIAEFAPQMGVTNRFVLPSMLKTQNFYSVDRGICRFHYVIKKTIGKTLDEEEIDLNELKDAIQTRLDQEYLLERSERIQILDVRKKGKDIHMMAMFIDNDSAWSYKVDYERSQLKEREESCGGVDNVDRIL